MSVKFEERNLRVVIFNSNDDSSHAFQALKYDLVEKYEDDLIKIIYATQASSEEGKIEIVGCPILKSDFNNYDKLVDMVDVLIKNDPNDMAADAVTIYEVWKKEAKQLLKEIENNYES